MELLFARKINNTENSGLVYMADNIPQLFCLCDEKEGHEIIAAFKKAEKWDVLGNEIAEYYSDDPEEEEDEFESDGLLGIGEAAASAFGYL